MSDRALQALQALDPGVPRSAWLAAAMGAKAAGVAFDEFDKWSSAASNYGGTGDCAAVWRSISPGGITEASLFAAAHAAGWRDGHPARVARRPLVAHPRRAAPTPARTVASAASVWAGLDPADDMHPYIRAKGGSADGLRVVPADSPLTIAGAAVAGWLVVPVCPLAGGEPMSLQFVPAPGAAKKLNLPGAKMDGVFVVGGVVADGKQTFVVEGVGQAWAVWRATGCAAVVTFGAGRMRAVAAELRELAPTAGIVLVPDAGQEATASEIAREVRGAVAAMPAGSPKNFDAADYAAQAGLDALAQLLAQASEPAGRFKVMTADQLAALPPVRWRVHGVLPSAGLAALYGASGSGKTFLALDMLGAIAEGRAWFGHRTDPCPVTVVALEGEAGIAQRVAAYRSKHGGVPSGMRFIAAPFALLEPGDVGALAGAIRAAGGADGIVCLDTLNAATVGSDENSSRDMGAIIGAAKLLQAALGGLVLAIHHAGKDLGRGLRGHSSLHAALDAVIEVRRDGDRREWRTSKAKDGADGAEHPFRLDVVELGIDQYGEPVTSCVIAPEEHAGDAVRRVRLPAGGNQRVVYDALGEAFRGAGDFGQAGAPAGRPCLRVETAVEHCRGRLTCPPDRQAERARSAITGLVSRGVLVLRDGWLYIP